MPKVFKMVSVIQRFSIYKLRNAKNEEAYGELASK